MDISWYGQAMFKLKGKAGTAVIDPFDPQFIGLKFPKDLEASVILSTHHHGDHSNTKVIEGHPLIIEGPGEYEAAGMTVVGIPTFHDKSEGSERGKNTVYHLFMDGLNIVHLGDLGHLLTEEQAGLIDTTVDILMVPVGGIFTIDAEEAAKVVAQLEPKIVIPMHYKLPDLKFELEGVEAFLKEMGAENLAPVPKLTITKDKLPEETTIVLLSKS
ncbi:MAG: MBL fold metallo-hydrolase [bacterium]|nr:MBL fold metallo-hydrolase [bacterium]